MSTTDPLLAAVANQLRPVNRSTMFGDERAVRPARPARRRRRASARHPAG